MTHPEKTRRACGSRTAISTLCVGLGEVSPSQQDRTVSRTMRTVSPHAPFDNVLEVGPDLTALLHRLEDPVAVASRERGVAAGPDRVAGDLYRSSGASDGFPVTEEATTRSPRRDGERTMTMCLSGWFDGSMVDRTDSGICESTRANLRGRKICFRAGEKSARRFQLSRRRREAQLTPTAPPAAPRARRRTFNRTETAAVAASIQTASLVALDLAVNGLDPNRTCKLPPSSWWR